MQSPAISPLIAIPILHVRLSLSDSIFFLLRQQNASVSFFPAASTSRSSCRFLSIPNLSVLLRVIYSQYLCRLIDFFRAASSLRLCHFSVLLRAVHYLSILAPFLLCQLSFLPFAVCSRCRNSIHNCFNLVFSRTPQSQLIIQRRSSSTKSTLFKTTATSIFRVLRNLRFLFNFDHPQLLHLVQLFSSLQSRSLRCLSTVLCRPLPLSSTRSLFFASAHRSSSSCADTIGYQPELQLNFTVTHQYSVLFHRRLPTLFTTTANFAFSCTPHSQVIIQLRSPSTTSGPTYQPSSVADPALLLLLR